MNNRGNYVDLKAITQEILGENYFQAFQNYFKSFFYSKSLKKEMDQKRYIVFITRRCSCLAYIFLQILRKKQEYDSKTNNRYQDRLVYLTDNSLINKGWEIGQLLLKKEGKLPEIILADDSMSYGRAITSIMGQFEEQVLKSIETEPDESLRWDAKQRFAEYRKRNIQIRVYAEKKQTNLLRPQDAEILRSEVTLPHYQWNDLSNRISELIINVNIANAAFVISRGIDGKEMYPNHWNPEGWQKVNWEYQDHRQTIFYYPVFAGPGRYKAVCSVRCIECGTIDRYRLIPFVFLPPMIADQIEEIEKKIFSKLQNADAGLKLKDVLKYDTFEEFKQNELDHITLRSRLDFITMYLSFSMLVSFQDQVGIGFGREELYDTEKVLWNYSDTEIRYSLVKQISLQKRQSTLFTKREIAEILNNIEGIEMKFFLEDLFYEFQKEEKKYDQKIKQSLINQCLEEYLFELGMEVERAAHEAVLSESKLGQYTLGSLQKRKYNPFCTFFSDVRKKLQQKSIRNCSVYELLSSVLQMMDAGLMSIASIRMNDGEKNGVGPEVRICEQALSVLPRRYIDHADVLMAVEQRGGSREDMEQYLREYCMILKEKNIVKSVEVAEEMAREMADFMNLLRRAGQKISYWTVGLKRHFVIERQKGGIKCKCSSEDIIEQREKFASAFRDKK